MREREREREADRQTDRRTDGQTDSHKVRNVEDPHKLAPSLNKETVNQDPTPFCFIPV